MNPIVPTSENANKGPPRGCWRSCWVNVAFEGFPQTIIPPLNATRPLILVTRIINPRSFVISGFSFFVCACVCLYVWHAGYNSSDGYFVVGHIFLVLWQLMAERADVLQQLDSQLAAADAQVGCRLFTRKSWCSEQGAGEFFSLPPWGGVEKNKKTKRRVE